MRGNPVLARPDLEARTAADLMTPNLVSLSAADSVPEIIAFLADRGVSAAPVIDEAGRPLGVVSRTDILLHDRERLAPPAAAPDYYHNADLTISPPAGEPGAAALGKGSAACARDLMTPAVFSVKPDTPAHQVAEQLVQLNVHRLFVVDDDGVLVGVITALDLLRHLCGDT
jgi:CBS domain-containing protein